MKEFLYQKFIIEALSRSEIAKELKISIHAIKRLLKRHNVKRLSRKENCIECGLKKVMSMGRCRSCYNHLPKQEKVIKVYREKIKNDTSIQKQLAAKRKERYKDPLVQEKQYQYKQTPKYKAYMSAYNEAYGKKHGRLKRPAIYWQNRWAKIQESDGCSVCHSKEKLEAHHITTMKRAKILGWTDEEMHAKDNLLILCKTHHRSKNISKQLHAKIVFKEELYNDKAD